MIIVHQEDLFRVAAVRHLTPGNKRGFMQTKLKNLRTVVGTENKFRSEDRVEHATLEIRAMQLSLHGLKISVLFMNIENYEQISSSAEDVRDSYAILLPEQIIGREFSRLLENHTNRLQTFIGTGCAPCTTHRTLTKGGKAHQNSITDYI